MLGLTVSTPLSGSVRLASGPVGYVDSYTEGASVSFYCPAVPCDFRGLPISGAVAGCQIAGKIRLHPKRTELRKRLTVGGQSAKGRSSAEGAYNAPLVGPGGPAIAFYGELLVHRLFAHDIPNSNCTRKRYGSSISRQKMSHLRVQDKIHRHPLVISRDLRRGGRDSDPIVSM